MSLRGAEREPKVRHGIFNVELYLRGGSFVRKFIIPSGLIPNSYKPKLFSAGAKLRGIKPDFRINTTYLQEIPRKDAEAQRTVVRRTAAVHRTAWRRGLRKEVHAACNVVRCNTTLQDSRA
jgi:hypothetical protein